MQTVTCGACQPIIWETSKCTMCDRKNIECSEFVIEVKIHIIRIQIIWNQRNNKPEIFNHSVWLRTNVHNCHYHRLDRPMIDYSSFSIFEIFVYKIEIKALNIHRQRRALIFGSNLYYSIHSRHVDLMVWELFFYSPSLNSSTSMEIYI